MLFYLAIVDTQKIVTRVFTLTILAKQILHQEFIGYLAIAM